MATVWTDADVESPYRLADLRDTVGRRPDLASLHAQITALEDRLGLTPKARRMLQWEIGQAEEAEVAPIGSGRRRHLRAVEG